MSAQQFTWPVSNPAITLPDGTETDLLNADGIGTLYADRAEFLVSNTGTTNAMTVKVYYSPTGVGWGVDATTYTVAHGASLRIPLNPITCSRLRITGTSTGGTTATIEGIWVRSAR